MAKKFSAEKVVELLERVCEEEDYPESSDDEIDRNFRYDFLDEAETGVLVTNLPQDSIDSVPPPHERDSLLLCDEELRSESE